ncbi:MAG: hypothetical protein NTY89_06210 [Nostocales cyanobacterium LacPavin_0920_SED1_MAG_38_18]|nr:hypothetical protein [Nostocales cyanobacterium LacPavin_0920_SED1_MAG_38_18]
MKRKCKCCQEKVECAVIPEDENENENLLEKLENSWDKFTTDRYQCTNCEKRFRADKEWLKHAKFVGALGGTIGMAINIPKTVIQVANGDLLGAGITIAKIIGKDDGPTIG